MLTVRDVERMIDWTEVSPADVVAGVIPSMYETKRLTAQANYGTEYQVNGRLDYDVFNNRFYS